MQLDLRDCKTAKEVWDKVQEMHKLKQPQLRDQALQQLLEFRYNVGEDANKHVDTFTDLFFKAKAAGEKIDDGRRCELFINSLPIEFDSVQTRFETSAKDNQTFTHLKTLFNNQVQKLERTRGNLGNDAFFTGRKHFNPGHKGNGANKDSGRQAKSKSEDECYYCRKKGHHKAECRKRQRDLKNGHNKDNNNGKISDDRTAYLASGFSGAIVGSDDCGDELSTMFYIDRKDSEIRFLLDLGATEHICGDRSAFSNLRSLPVPKGFRTVNGMAYSEEVGEVIVQGSAAGDVTLGNVHYLPNSPTFCRMGLSSIRAGSPVSQPMEVSLE